MVENIPSVGGVFKVVNDRVRSGPAVSTGVWCALLSIVGLNILTSNRSRDRTAVATGS